ncbi:diphosphoinositol polyphosphate phosphohydrolase 1-like [Tubulanus polymorphus]|uniref:diphosphoinositol polyphosphate phosphohydrolase 1-like n=1 Tax=Tubulanus polymorphus TaxID=672921 RepID=UPI003DA57138
MVKEKLNQIRTYDAEGFKRRAACLCFKDKTQQEILLVSSSGTPGRWVIPGGGIEPTEDAGVAAAREACEEGGVKGNLSKCIGNFENAERKHRTAVYILIVTELLDDWDDAKSLGRKRKWFALEEAKTELKQFKPVQRQYLDLLENCKDIIYNGS